MLSQMNRHTQQIFDLARGAHADIGPAGDASIARSWLRCLQQHQLDPSAGASPSVLGEHDIQLRRERLQQVMAISTPEMQSLQRQLDRDGRAILLTDAQGVILSCLTGEPDRRDFERAGLLQGADWSEGSEGTNGIGTCVIERQALSIHRDEHFRNHHLALTCSASPVFDPDGELLAVLDVSSVRRDESRQSQFHTMAMVNLSAKVIESCYFLKQFDDYWLLRLHAQPTHAGLLHEGLLAFDGEGCIRAINLTAQNLLGVNATHCVGRSIEAVLHIKLTELFDRLRSQRYLRDVPLQNAKGWTVFAQLREPLGLTTCTSMPPLSRTVDDVASVFYSQDEAILASMNKAVRVYARDIPILVQGETGSGKEAFARALHAAGPRRHRPFVALNCAAIPENLIESELFGYEGGSFTGARKQGMRGKLVLADGGTLFLDEIGDMPLTMQTRLLRVLEDRQVMPVGGHQLLPVDVRIISATHRNLAVLVEEGKFREDLYYRLNGFALTIPPLRNRTDKKALLKSILHQAVMNEVMVLEPAAEKALLAYHWPGNVRQLRGVIRTLAALQDGEVITVGDLPSEIRASIQAVESNVGFGGELLVAERTALIQMLTAQRWNMTKTAAALGVSRNTLYRKLNKHGIDYQAKRMAA